MYRILGGDGNEYGPATPEQLSQWIAEKRVDGETRVRGEDGTWRLLREVPELAGLLQPPPALPPTLPVPWSAPGEATFVPSEFDGDYDLDIGACLVSSWRLLRRKSSAVFGVMMAYLAICIGLVILGGLPYIGILFSLVSLVIGGPLMGGLYCVYLRLIRGESPPLGSLFDGFRKAFAQMFLGQLVPGILGFVPLVPGIIVLVGTVGVGLLRGGDLGLLRGGDFQSFDWPKFALLLPGLGLFLIGLPAAVYLGVGWMFTLPLILDQSIDFWTAMNRSRRQVSRHWWSCLAFLLLFGILNFVGALFCGVGLLVTWPVSMLATMYMYETVIHGRKAS